MRAEAPREPRGPAQAHSPAEGTERTRRKASANAYPSTFLELLQASIASDPIVCFSDMATLKIGMRLPTLTLPAQDRSTRSLPDPSGPNLLVFYRGDW